MRNVKKFLVILISIFIAAALVIPASADKVNFEYKLKIYDQYGAEVTNPRTLAAGSTLNIEIEISRSDITDTSYYVYGLEFRIRTRGLDYNNDGVSFRGKTSITKQVFLEGDSVGFAYFDTTRVGETVSNPMAGGSWSYTVTDPSAINIVVPVALMYEPDSKDPHELEGDAYFYLDPNGGTIIGKDPSGKYRSGTEVTLPDAERGGYIFKGWSDGVRTYKAGTRFSVSGIITLTALWEEIPKNRQVTFDPNGGEFAGEDPSGMYADGEVLHFPELKRDGYRVKEWNDGVKSYKPDEDYTVYNSVIIKASWEEYIPEPPGPEPGPGTSNWWIWLLVGIGALALGGGIWWFIIFWKRKWVKYSLVNGDISLSFKDKKHTVKVAVVLYDDDDKKYLLGNSHLVEAGKRLRFIKGDGSVADIEKGRYKGMLVVAGENYTDSFKCRIKALDREIKEKKND